MQNVNNDIKLESNVDTSSDNVDTSSAIDNDILSNFGDIETENDLAEKEKLEELNKKLPSWSIEPPHTFVK
ncbi:MAG: hypothetical protein ACI32E_03100 [Bacilli bacterium]